jgi:hypothetical protein
MIDFADTERSNSTIRESMLATGTNKSLRFYQNLGPVNCKSAVPLTFPPFTQIHLDLEIQKSQLNTYLQEK